MANVYNWQLGRDMSYPYEGKYPREQFAFVFNINRCIACQSCTMACKSTWTFERGQEHMWWTNVETKPYGGYPYAWDVKLLELLDQANPEGMTWREGGSAERAAPYGTYEGRTTFEAAESRVARPEQAQRVLGYLPADEEWATPNLHEDVPPAPAGVRITRITPSWLRVTLARATTRTMRVVPQIRGAPAPQHALYGLQVEPPTVELRGPRSTLEARDTVETVPVDISGSRERISQGVGLMLPDGVYPTSQRTVQVTVDIRARLFAHLQALSLSFYDRRTVGSVMSRVRSLSILTILSPDFTPALCAGVPSIGEMTVSKSSLIVISMPSPPNSPRVLICISSNTSGVRSTVCGSSVRSMPFTAAYSI